MKITDTVCRLISGTYPLLLTDGTTLLPVSIPPTSLAHVNQFKEGYGELHYEFEHPSLSLLQIRLHVVLTKLIESPNSILVEISLISNTEIEVPHFTYERMFEETDFTACTDFDASFIQWITNSTFALVPLAKNKFDTQLAFDALNPWVAESMVNLINEVDEFYIQKKIRLLDKEKILIDRRFEALERIRKSLNKESDSISLRIQELERIRSELWV